MNAQVATMSATDPVTQDAVALVTAALSNAKQAGAFDAVSRAMVIAIAAVVRHEGGPQTLDDLLALAASV
jgi:hypothetical protein